LFLTSIINVIKNKNITSPKQLNKYVSLRMHTYIPRQVVGQGDIRRQKVLPKRNGNDDEK